MALRLALATFCLIAAQLCFAVQPYEPVKSDPFDEPWRWSEYEFLNEHIVRHVDQDLDGRLWFGIENGILEYDGYRTTRHLFPDADLPDSPARVVHAASDGAVYVLASRYAAMFKGGVWRRLFETANLRFTTSRIDESSDGSIWFGTPSGLYRFFQGELALIESELDAFSSLLVDRNNRLWLASAYTGEILRYDLDHKTGLPVGSPYRISSEPVSGRHNVELHEGPSGRLWIASSSRKQALRVFEDETVRLVLESWASIGLRSNRTIAEGPDGRFWVASQRALATYMDDQWTTRAFDQHPIPNSLPFLKLASGETLILGGQMDQTYAIDFSDGQWQTYSDLNFHCRDLSGSNWFISVDKQVIRNNPSADSWKSYSSEDGVMDMPNSLIATRDGRVWAAGSHGENAAVAWFEDGRWTRREHDDFSSLISHLSAYEGRDGSVYFGSGGESYYSMRGRPGGLIRYREENGELVFRYLKPPHYPRRIVGIAETENGELWFGGSALAFKREGLPFERDDGFFGNWIDYVTVSKDNQLWIASWGVGVYRKTGGNWERFPELDQLAGRRFVDLLAGEKLPGVWLATSDGISRFDGRTWSQYPLSQPFRLQREGGRLLESRDGSLWINSATRSWNFNQEARPGEAATPFRTTRHTPDQLGPETWIVSFEPKLQESGNAHFKWAGVDAWSRTAVRDLEYSYRVNEDEWSPYQKAAETLLPSMKSGRYRLEVRARDADWNVDATPATVSFTVIPFLWKRPWFIASVILTVGLIATLGFLLVQTRVRHLLEIEEFKLQFFTNVSHELRTPLAVILGPLESLMKENLGKRAHGLVSMTVRNARKMQGLVNQLLEFRKVELGKLQYHPIRSDIVLFLKDAIYSHAPLWEKKEQEFTLHIELEEKIVCFDPDKLQRIVDNLLSNAIKYTPHQGRIEVSIDISPTRKKNAPYMLTLEISDTGVGISREMGDVIFKPFHRVQAGQRQFKGSGIGLAYTKELVDLWRGQIDFISPIYGTNGTAGGTRFIVSLPLVEDQSAPACDHVPELDAYLAEDEMAEAESPTSASKSERTSILLVEDNPDLRTFLQGELGSEYQIIEAKDGREGLDTAIDTMPDLIISDIMMPEMDGLELCSILKTKEETSHIPIVMLTARTSEENRLKGIEMGADEYFPKPVNIALLKARIENLLESRRKLRELFSRRVVVQPSEVTVTSTDEAFLQRAMKIVEERMRDEDFDVEAFSKKMGMSRVTLYRKMKAVTGEPPFQFIRAMRLKRAAQLLETGQVTVGETLEHIGILDMSYFSKIFRKEYGKPPSEYRKG